MNENWIDHELRNWARWANSGPSECPAMPGSFLGTWVLPEPDSGDVDAKPAPIHEDNAKRVQKVFDVARKIERKVLQAEYLSPWRYGRNKGIPSAIQRIKADDPDMVLNVAGYETVLGIVKRRVAKVFQ
ncbi:hypothetical protein [Paraburkholderia sp. RL18-085-BIA-A]|uniref:hypothetical protein n=1 Tax=Paraburkholderia sp. RL18-085-BIA-A TaxID=3031633 RepID=UPI0038B77DA9